MAQLSGTTILSKRTTLYLGHLKLGLKILSESVGIMQGRNLKSTRFTFEVNGKRYDVFHGAGECYSLFEHICFQ